MTKPIRTVAATRCSQIEGLPINPQNSFHARGDDGRQYYVKTHECRKIPGRRNATWLGNESIYYSVARRSNLLIPHSAILNIDGQLYWGSEYLRGRDALPRDEAQANERLRQTCERSGDALSELGRALLLDVALLNSDRRPWNMLHSEDGRLWFFDHEKSLLGDGREPGDSPAGDLVRIHDDSLTDYKVGDYLACAVANKLILGCLSDQDISDIFGSLALSSESLDAARAECPIEWVSADVFSRLQQFLGRWWEHLRRRFSGDAPRCYLTHTLLSRGLL